MGGWRSAAVVGAAISLVSGLLVFVAISAPEASAVSVAPSAVSNAQNQPPIYSNWPKNATNWPCYATPSYACTQGRYSSAAAISSGWPNTFYGQGFASTNSYGLHNCTLYAAYRLEQNGFTPNPDKTWGNADQWAQSAANAGIEVDQTPAVGSIAQWNVPTAIGGHVAYVDAVQYSGSTVAGITITEDNYMPESAASFPGGYTAEIHISVGAAVWPANFIHAKDAGTSASAGSKNVAVNGGFENGWGPWATAPGSNYVDYQNGQVTGESARSGVHYGATNTSQNGGGIYQNVPVSASAGNVYCASAWVRTQYPATGASGTFVVWLLGGSYNENGVASFSGLSNGANWRQVQTCVSASTPHTQLRIQLYPATNAPTLDIDDIDVH